MGGNDPDGGGDGHGPFQRHGEEEDDGILPGHEREGGEGGGRSGEEDGEEHSPSRVHGRDHENDEDENLFAPLPPGGDFFFVLDCLHVPISSGSPHQRSRHRPPGSLHYHSRISPDHPHPQPLLPLPGDETVVLLSRPTRVQRSSWSYCLTLSHFPSEVFPKCSVLGSIPTVSLGDF
jgi:hypothetical protein